MCMQTATGRIQSSARRQAVFAAEESLRVPGREGRERRRIAGFCAWLGSSRRGVLEDAAGVNGEVLTPEA